MCGIAEIDFIRMHGDPASPQSARKVSTQHDASSCTTVTHTMVETLAAVPDIRSLAQGETTARPRPVPNRNRTSERAAAPTAPAITAPQETAPFSLMVVMALTVRGQPRIRCRSA